jgi:ATP-binding cassette subfamily F protein 3
VLSGGEKSRLSLAVIMANPGNLLLLDEPTNHLDIESIERLAEVLEEFDGTMLVVSHDEYLLNRTCTRVLEMRANSIRDFPGTLRDYRSYVEEGLGGWGGEAAGEQKGVGEQTAVAEKERRKKQRAGKRRAERAVEKAEREVASLEEKIEETRAALASPDNATDYLLLQDLTERLDLLNVEHEQAMADWERLHQRLSRMVDE